MSGNMEISRGKPIDLGSFTDAELEELPVGDIPAGSAELGYNTGFAAGAAAGFDFGNYRIESEFVYQMNNFDDITLSYTIPDIGSYSNSINVDGDVEYATHSVILNLRYYF